jgi:hypothetical protein
MNILNHLRRAFSGRRPVPCSAWHPSTETPTRNGEYVCVTNFGDVFALLFYEEAWKPAARFNRGEKVAWWTPMPNATHDGRRGETP